MDKKAKIILAVSILIILMGLSYAVGNAGSCFEGEYCFIQWQFESEKYCDGGLYTLEFCYNSNNPGNRDYQHFHSYCASGIISNLPVNYVFLPLIIK